MCSLFASGYPPFCSEDAKGLSVLRNSPKLGFHLSKFPAFHLLCFISRPLRIVVLICMCAHSRGNTRLSCAISVL